MLNHSWKRQGLITGSILGVVLGGMLYLGDSPVAPYVQTPPAPLGAGKIALGWSFIVLLLGSLGWAVGWMLAKALRFERWGIICGLLLGVAIGGLLAGLDRDTRPHYGLPTPGIADIAVNLLTGIVLGFMPLALIGGMVGKLLAWLFSRQDQTGAGAPR